MRIILLFAALFVGSSIFAQSRYPGLDNLVIKVNKPSIAQGTYKVMGTADSVCYAWLNGGTGGKYWGIKDVTKTSIESKFVLVNDTTGVKIVNGADLVGNIAVLYYGGGIKYKQKMINAQAAGAIALIIIADKDGVESYPGGDGDEAALGITIPMFVMQNTDGKLLVSALKTEVVYGYVGEKKVYNNDIKLDLTRALTPARLTNITALVQADEVVDSLGIVVTNNGKNPLDSVLCEVLVKFGNDTLHHDFKGVKYSDSLGNVKTVIEPGKSIGYITFEPFKNKENLKAGKYTLTYSAFSTVKSSPEEFEVDNTITIPFVISDTVYSPTIIENWDRKIFKDTLRDGNGKPVVPTQLIFDTIRYKNVPYYTSFFQPSVSYSSYGQCLVFKDANASRVKGTSMTFMAWFYNSSEKLEVTMKGEPFKINVLEWADNFKGFSDTANYKFNNLVPLIDNQEFISQETSSWGYQTVKFDDEVLFENDKRYLVCVQSSSPNVRFGFDVLTASLDPRTRFYDQPLNMTIRMEVTNLLVLDCIKSLRLV